MYPEFCAFSQIFLNFSKKWVFYFFQKVIKITFLVIFKKCLFDFFSRKLVLIKKFLYFFQITFANQKRDFDQFLKKVKNSFFSKNSKKICGKALLKILFKRFFMYQDPFNVTKTNSKKIWRTLLGNLILSQFFSLKNLLDYIINNFVMYESLIFFPSGWPIKQADDKAYLRTAITLIVSF